MIKKISLIFVLQLFFQLNVFSQEEKKSDCITIKDGYENDSIVVLGQTKKFIKNKYGRPDISKIITIKENKYIEGKEHKFKRVTTEKYGRSESVYTYNSLELAFEFDESDSVKSIIIGTDKYCTSKGLKVGDSMEKAYSLYGEGSCKVLRNSREGIVIYFDCGVVESIEIKGPY